VTGQRSVLCVIPAKSRIWRSQLCPPWQGGRRAFCGRGLLGCSDPLWPPSQGGKR
jgi:hypothetical protein